MGTFLTSPRDEKTWHRLLHRALFTRNQDPKARVKECRLKCRMVVEDMLHLATCSRTRKVRKLTIRIWTAMGEDPADLLTPITWICGLRKDLKALSEPARAVLALHWRTLYKHLVFKDTRNISFRHKVVEKDILKELMARILSYQQDRRLFTMAREHAGDVVFPTGTNLPEKLAAKLAPIGELDTTRGTIKVRPELTAIFNEYGVWREFD